MIRVYGLKNCDTCRKALKQLPNAELVDVRSDGMPEALLRAAFEQFGDDLLNTRSATWRGLGESDRARAPLDLMAEHPAVMKRPLFERDGDLWLGWTDQTRAALGVG